MWVACLRLAAKKQDQRQLLGSQAALAEMPSLGCQVNRITGTRGAAGVANGALASGGDSNQISGNYISTVVGVRIATPLFGTGFNFCVGVPSTPVKSPAALELAVHIAH